MLVTSIRYGATFFPIIPCTLAPFLRLPQHVQHFRTDSSIGSASSLLLKLSSGPPLLGLSCKVVLLEASHLLLADDHANSGSDDDDDGAHLDQ